MVAKAVQQLQKYLRDIGPRHTDSLEASLRKPVPVSVILEHTVYSHICNRWQARKVTIADNNPPAGGGLSPVLRLLRMDNLYFDTCAILPYHKCGKRSATSKHGIIVRVSPSPCYKCRTSCRCSQSSGCWPNGSRLPNRSPTVSMRPTALRKLFGRLRLRVCHNGNPPAWNCGWLLTAHGCIAHRDIWSIALTVTAGPSDHHCSSNLNAVCCLTVLSLQLLPALLTPA